MRTTHINLYQDSSMPFVHRHCLMNNNPKKNYFLLSLVFLPNDIPTQRSGRRNFIPPFVRNPFLKSLLNSDPLPIKLVE